MNQNASICADWNCDYDYSYTQGVGREANWQSLQSQEQMLQVLELIAYAGTKLFYWVNIISTLLFSEV